MHVQQQYFYHHENILQRHLIILQVYYLYCLVNFFRSSIKNIISLKLNPLSQVLIQITLGDFCLFSPICLKDECQHHNHLLYCFIRIIQRGSFAFVSSSTSNCEAPRIFTKSELNFSTSLFSFNCIYQVISVIIQNQHCLKHFEFNFFVFLPNQYFTIQNEVK